MVENGPGPAAAHAASAEPGQLAAELRRLGETANKQRLAHLIRKLAAAGQGQGPPLSKAEARELEAAGNPPPVSIPGEPERVTSAAALARILGCNPGAVRRWRRMGMPVRPDETYDVAACRAWAAPRIAKRDAPAEGRTTSPDDRRFRRAKADLVELRLARERAELIPRADVVRGLVARWLIVRRRLEVLPRLAAPQLQGLDARAVEAWLRAWTRETLAGFLAEPWPAAAGPMPASMRDPTLADRDVPAVDLEPPAERPEPARPPATVEGAPAGPASGASP